MKGVARRRVGRNPLPLQGCLWLCAWLLVAPFTSGCGGERSALNPAGRDAEKIAELFYWMVGGAVVVWLIVMALAIYAIRHRPADPDRRKVRLLIVGGGTVFPTVVLTGLLAFGLQMMPDLLDDGPEDGTRITVTGEQWWWRVRYDPPDGDGFELANELRLPRGERVPIWLRAADVIHAFWVPALAGKTDMIPGRVNRMALEPTRTGTFRGICAEYCGLSHAKMEFSVVVLERPEYDAWIAAQRQPARPPTGPVAARGQTLFSSLGCSACHTIRGTGATGVLGPDLTHVGSRTTLGAGILPNDIPAFLKWLTDLHRFKPGVKMPSFEMIPEEERLALATYLEGLE